MKTVRFGFSAACMVLAMLLVTCGEEELAVPECVKTLFPLNKQFVPQGETVKLRWEGSHAASSYDVFFGEGSEEPALFAEGVTATEISVNVSPETDVAYSWYVIPRNADG